MAVLVADIPILQASYFMACRNFLKQKKISRYYAYIDFSSSCQVVIGKIVLYILLVLIGWDKWKHECDFCIKYLVCTKSFFAHANIHGQSKISWKIVYENGTKYMLMLNFGVCLFKKRYGKIVVCMHIIDTHFLKGNLWILCA